MGKYVQGWAVLAANRRPQIRGLRKRQNVGEIHAVIADGVAAGVLLPGSGVTSHDIAAVLGDQTLTMFSGRAVMSNIGDCLGPHGLNLRCEKHRAIVQGSNSTHRTTLYIVPRVLPQVSDDFVLSEPVYD